MNKKLFFLLPFLLSGCETIYNAADSIGSHLPTIGEPCRHWQCVTSSGQQKSNQIKQMQEAPLKKPFPVPASTTTPPPPAQ